MKDNSLPTADYNEFKDYDNASKYLATKKMPIVVKYDGLAAGKELISVIHLTKQIHLSKIY